MAKRLLAFALAFVVVGGPLAGELCEAFCAEHAEGSIDSTMPVSQHDHSAGVASPPSHHHYSDAAPAPATRSAGFVPLPRWCGHLEATVSESRELTRARFAIAVVTVARVTPPRVHPLPTSRMDSRHGPPASPRSTSPLRV